MPVTLKILLIEDTESDIATCVDAVRRFNHQNKEDFVIELTTSDDLEKGCDLLDNSFAGAIIDLKLNTGVVDGEYQGNDVIRLIQDRYRIPFAVLTGTPEQAIEEKPTFFDIFKKGEKEYIELFNDFLKIHKTGVTKIFGGEGLFETTMDKVFWDNIVPHFSAWKEQSELKVETERALLRYSLNHLIEKLDNDSDICVPEEMYIAPPASTSIKTGSIVQCKISNIYFIILSPACDLAIRGSGAFKTDRVLVCAIDEFAPIRDEIIATLDDEHQNASYKRAKIEELIKNNWKICYHWLPNANDFSGGIINFRKVETYSPAHFNEIFEVPKVQVVSHFIKDIISRYSAFYARQGQPDLPFAKVAKKLYSEMIAE